VEVEAHTHPTLVALEPIHQHNHNHELTDFLVLDIFKAADGLLLKFSVVIKSKSSSSPQKHVSKFYPEQLQLI
jgi:hypothetical protein